jgi:hypothetical protein
MEGEWDIWISDLRKRGPNQLSSNYETSSSPKVIKYIERKEKKNAVSEKE